MKPSASRLVAEFIGQQRVIPIPTIFVQMLAGDYHTAAFLTQAIYWWYATGEKPYYKSDAEWRKELYLSERQVPWVRKQAERFGIRSYRAGLPARMHYVFEEEVFESALRDVIAASSGTSADTSSDHVSELESYKTSEHTMVKTDDITPEMKDTDMSFSANSVDTGLAMSPNGDACVEKREVKIEEKSQKPAYDSEGPLPSLELVRPEQPTQVSTTTPRSVRRSRRGGADYDELLAAWNDYCGPLPRATRLNDQRRRALKRLVDEHGDEAVALLTDATRQVARDEFWIERGYGLDNLLRSGRVVEKVEKYRATSSPLSTGERRMATTAASIARAIGGFK